jgi:hypothetical protein
VLTAKPKDESKSFIWKEAVDSIRDASYQARQLSSFLGLLSRFWIIVVSSFGAQSPACAGVIPRKEESRDL